VQVGDHCVLGIKSTLAGNCVLDEHVILSSGVILQQKCHIGAWTVIQSGTRLSKDVPPYIIVSGNPPAYHGVNAKLLTQKEVMSDDAQRQLMKAYLIIYQGNVSMEDALIRIRGELADYPEVQNVLEFIKNTPNVLQH